MSTLQIRDLPAKAALDGTELVELQEVAGGAGSSKQAPSGSFLPPDYISGLKMVWSSGTSLSVSNGSAFIPSLGRVVRSGTTLTLPGLTLTASTWYHVYLYNNAGVPAIECVTTAPAAPYYGTARTKTGDTSRRYIGSVLTDASGNVFNFTHSEKTVKYVANVNSSPFRVLSGGKATTATNVSCSAAIPMTAILASLLLLNTDTSQSVYLGNSNLSPPLSTESYMGFIFINSSAMLDMPLDSSKQFNYMYATAPTGAAYARVTGYTYER